MKIRMSMCVLSALLVVGCANLDQAHRTEVQSELVPGRGVLVISRDAGLSLGSDIEVDGKSRCQLEEKTFCMLRLTPGKYTVTGSGYFGKGAQMGLRKIGVQVTITDQLHTFVMIDSKFESGYVIPTPWIIAAGATTSTRFFTTDIESFLKLRFLLKRVEPMPT